jgi:hypothetical protein
MVLIAWTNKLYKLFIRFIDKGAGVMTEAAKKLEKPASTKSKPKSASVPGKSPALQVPAAAAAKTGSKPSRAETAKNPSAAQASRLEKNAVEPAAKEGKPHKAKKIKLVRDSFTMPESEYRAIATLKTRCLALGVVAKKSQLLRAAIATLAKLTDADVAAALQGLEEIKTGRPAKAAG